MSNNNYESEDKLVSHPDHYQSKGGLEVIDVIKSFTAELKGIEATDTGNVIKYICRWSKKNGIQDLEKAQWYLTHLINEVKARMEPIETKGTIASLSDNPRFYTYEDAERVLKEIKSTCLALGGVSVAELRKLSGRVSTKYDETVGWRTIPDDVQISICSDVAGSDKLQYQLTLPVPEPLVVKFNELKESK